VKIIVTGSRIWTNESIIRNAFALIAMRLGPENMTIVHGACPSGADYLSDNIARAWTGMTVKAYPADWAKHGKAAGPIRNMEMVDGNLDALCALAFPIDQSRGTRHCMSYARGRGIEVVDFDPRNDPYYSMLRLSYLLARLK
jgi:SLOG family YspA-like protein